MLAQHGPGKADPPPTQVCVTWLDNCVVVLTCIARTTGQAGHRIASILGSRQNFLSLVAGVTLQFTDKCAQDLFIHRF